MAYQTLYRRYRSQRFSDLRGQEHVVRALRSAVRDERVGHAYLFSGPRGTGKTSTARILAKALNCDHLDDGDPCGACESCRSIEAGRSFDLHELDAASNNGVEAIRDLISRTGIGSPGRTKVYILDEVHMLSAGASNALLKTLEDPPPHVVFVLATTDPHKVLPTIRSRTQHLEFGLIPAEVLAEHLRWVIADAGLDVDDAAVAYALRQGGGSARDTLSALEQVVSAGGLPAEGGSIDALVDALCERDSGAALVAVAAAMAVGREPRPLAEELMGVLRDVFLASVGGPLDHLTDAPRAQAGDRARRMGRASITRALELVGEAIADMRHVGDTRIPLEVALVRLTRPELDTSIEALLDRVARLERQVDSGSVPASPAAGSEGPAAAPPPPPSPAPPPTSSPAPPAPPTSSSPTSSPAPPSPPPTSSPAPPASTATRADEAAAAPAPASPVEPAAAPPAATTGAGPLPTLDALRSAWPSSIAGRLSNRARARFGAGHFVDVADGAAVFALPNPIHRDRCEDLRPEVEQALAAHFGGPVPVRLTVDAGGPGSEPGPGGAPSGAGSSTAAPPSPAARPSGPTAPATTGASPDGHPDDDDDLAHIDISELADADVPASSPVDRITELFPGAEVIEE